MTRRRAAQAKAEGGTFLRVSTADVYGGLIPGRADAQAQGELAELAASIARHGLLQPIVVRRNAQAGRYALVCGARRLAACRMLGMTHIDAVVTSAEELPGGAKRLLERIRRGGLHCTEEAELLQTLHSRLGVSVHGLAEALRCAPEDIERRLSLMQLSAPVRQVLRARPVQPVWLA